MSAADRIRDGTLARDARGRIVTRHTCSECGEAFYPSRADAKYCSNACRQAAYRKRHAASVTASSPL